MGEPRLRGRQAASREAGLALLETAVEVDGLPRALLVQPDVYQKAAELAGNEDERRLIAQRLADIGEA